MGHVTADRGLLLGLLLLALLGSPLEHAHRWPHHVDGQVRLRDGVTCPGPHSREVAAPGFGQRRCDWRPLPFLTHRSAPCHILPPMSALGQDPIPDISGAQWMPQRGRRGVIDAATEEEEDEDEISPLAFSGWL